MVAAGVFAGLHRLARALQQRLQRVTFAGLAGSDAHGQADAVAPPAKVRGPRQAGETPRMLQQKLRGALVRQHQELVVAPAADDLGRLHLAQQGLFDRPQHGLACVAAMGLAQRLRPDRR